MSPPNPYAGWATATAGDAQGSYPSGAAAAAALPAATRWSRSPPAIAPQARYGPPPQMPAPAYAPAPAPVPGTWDPRLAQVPAGYPLPSGYGAPNVPTTMPAAPLGQYVAGGGSPATPYQPSPFAPPLGNAFLPLQGFATPQPQQVAPQPQQVVPPPSVPPSGSTTEADDKVPPNEEILAYVGPEVILMGDVLPDVEHALKQALKGKAPPPKDQMEKIREGWIRGRLKHTIEVRQTLVAVRQKIQNDDTKYRDIRKQMGDAFEKKRVKQLVEEMKEKGITSRDDLEHRSTELFGIPFSRVKETFIDEMLAFSFVSQQLPKDEEISHADALAYYQAHEADFEFPAKARWEEITVKYGAAKHPREEAWRIIAQCGNAIIGGAKFDAIARQYSEDPISAKNGGAHDWIGQGSLVCEKLDRALFDAKLPVGTLSPIIEDGDAFYIIRVTERRAAGKTPFAEAQKEIKEKLKKERQEAMRKEFMLKIRQQVPVRNVYEEQHPAPPPQQQQPSREQREDDE